MRQRINTIIVAAVVSALAVAGLAVAQGDDGGSGNGGNAKQRMRPPGPPPGGPGFVMFAGPGEKNLTYTETHLRKDGEDVTVRVDKGKVTAVDADSISIERNDGETLDIPVDEDTHVLVGPRNPNADIEDVAVGKQASVVRRSGSDTAEAVLVMPKHPPRFRGAFGRHDRGGGPGLSMPVPPPGGDQG